MKTLLIAEDEKMIRQGLKAMIQRSDIEVEEILECQNGQEALEIIKTKQIDVLFTDIRMPKMDGITLLNTLSQYEEKPEIVVISGYDDFSYAVEALKCGAREYILKPVNREDIYKIMKKLDEVVEGKKNLENKIEAIDEMVEQQIKYILLNDTITQSELESFKKGFKEHWLNTVPYTVFCLHQQVKSIGDLDCVTCTIDNDCIVITKVQDAHGLEEELKEKHIGISSTYEGICHLRLAYEQALLARRYAYIMNKPCLHYNEVPIQKTSKIEDKIIKQIVQLVGTERREDFEEAFEEVLGEAHITKLIYDDFEKLMEKMMGHLLESYGSIIDITEFGKVKYFYQYSDYKSYQAYLKAYLFELNEKICSAHENSRALPKIQDALDFIGKNYAKDLNMAMVSNHISMNYSCFSQLFKEYTGMSFVNYMKEIRISKAKELLATTSKKVAEIGYAVGYENEKHFMKVFKGVTGISPTEYRKNNQLMK